VERLRAAAKEPECEEPSRNGSSVVRHTVDPIRSRASWAAPLAIFAVAMAARTAFSLSLEDRLYWSDEHQYLRGVSQIFDKGMWYLAGSYKPPGYVYFLASVRAVFGEGLTAIRLVQSALGALTCLLTFEVAKRVFSRRAALLAAGYVAVYPLHIYVSGVVMPQALESTLIMGLLLLLVCYDANGSRRFTVLAGLLLGFGALTVPLILALYPAACVWLLARGNWRIGAAAKEAILLGACALCVILPWTARNYVLEKRFVFIATLGNQLLYLHNNPWADPDDKEGTRATAFRIKDEVRKEAESNPSGLTEDEIYMQRFKEYVSQHPGRFILMYLKKFRNFFALTPATFSSNEHTARRNRLIAAVTYAPVLVLSVLGTAVSFARRRKGLLLASVPVLFALGYSLFHTTVRYRIPTEPCSIALASFALLWLIAAVRGKEATT